MSGTGGGAGGMIGHNRGPAMDDGVPWRRHCWTVARAELLPSLPLEVIRLRVRRARELGLDYRTYALARETTGRDIVAFLYSSNALGVLAPAAAMPEARAERLRAVTACVRALAAHAPLDAGRLAADLAAAQGLDFAAAGAAPGFWAPWREVRERVRAALGPFPAGGVMLVGDAPGERAWCDAAGLAGYLPAERYFAAAPA